MIITTKKNQNIAIQKNKQIIKQNVEYLNKIIYNLYIIIYKNYNHKIGRRLN